MLLHAALSRPHVFSSLRLNKSLGVLYESLIASAL